MNANKQLIEMFEQKIKHRIGRVCGSTATDTVKKEYKVADESIQIDEEL